MRISGRHDYRGMKVEKEERRQRGILPNSSDLTASEPDLTEPLVLTSLLEPNIAKIGGTEPQPNLTGPWQHYLRRIPNRREFRSKNPGQKYWMFAMMTKSSELFTRPVYPSFRPFERRRSGKLDSRPWEFEEILELLHEIHREGLDLALNAWEE